MSSRKVKKAEIFENKFLNIVYEDGTLCQIDLERLFDIEFIKENKMNKELTLLEEALDTIDVLKIKYSGFENWQKRLNIVESALKRLKQIEINQTIFENNPITVGNKIMALEIIKKKRVDVNDLLLFVDLKSYNDYVCACDDDSKRVLTQEEYVLLKEVLL